MRKTSLDAYNSIRHKLTKKQIEVYSFVYGIGGRDFYYKDAERIIKEVLKK